MELSDQMHSLQLRGNEFKKHSAGAAERNSWNKDFEGMLYRDDLIDIDQFDFSNDENWLCGSSGRTNVDLRRWLYEDISKSNDTTLYSHNSSSPWSSDCKKAIDTRTFTRPKKKYSRPNIEHYTQEMYSNMRSNGEDALSQEIENYMSSSRRADSLSGSIINEDIDTRHNKPLHFDLSQPSSANIFDNILMNAVDVDSFQNMSPPSLVNSMCSSTFTNLMENSFIKNDPVLREIRDADYSGEILHDTEPQLFQSFTESCSSLNSDSAESFLRRTLPTLNGTFNSQSHQNSTYNSDSDTANNTLIKQNEMSDSDIASVIEEDLNATFVKMDSTKELDYSNNLNSSYVIEGNLNNTFKRNLTKDISYDMSSSNNSDTHCDGVENNSIVSPRKLQNDQFVESNRNISVLYGKDAHNSSLTDVYFNSNMSGSATMKKQLLDKSHCENIDPNTTIAINPPSVLNGTFRKSHKSNNITKNRDLTVCTTNNFTNQLDKTISLGDDLDDPLNRTTNYNIIDEAGDHQSSYNPSKIDAKRNSVGYVTGSTDSLDHTSSLSNSSRGSNRMLNMSEVDAIVEEQERSLQVASTPKPAKSMTKLFESHVISPISRQKEHVSDSDLSSTEDYLTVRSTLSKGSSGHSEKNLKVLDRNVRSLSNLKQNLDQKVKPHNIYTIAKHVSTVKPHTGSHANLQGAERNLRGSQTNLKSFGIALKGSYTNLRPIGLNLPVITSKPSSAPISARNVDLDTTQTIPGTLNDEVFKVPHILSAQTQSASAPNSAKPQSRGSCLPRPVSTGIPRAVSKIPGPRMIRPPSARAVSRLSNRPNEG